MTNETCIDKNYGLSQQTLRVIEDIFRNNIPSGIRVIVSIFGSRAKGTHSTYSDVDLLIECEALPPGTLSKIAESLEESSLPYKFDLVDAAKLATEYEHSVQASKRVMFAF